MKVLDRMERIVGAISLWSGRLTSYLIIILCSMICYEVVARYVFNRPTLWCHELSTMFYGTFFILGGAYTFHAKGHATMDIFYSRMGKRGRALINIIGFGLGVCFLGVLFWEGGRNALQSISELEHASTPWGPPIWPFKLMLPVGAFLFLMQITVTFFRDVLILFGRGKER